MTRRPTTSITVTKTADLDQRHQQLEDDAAERDAVVRGRPAPRSAAAPAPGPSTRSSTTSQPTAMRPRSVSSMCRSCKARTMTTVLATDRARPNTKPGLPRPAQHAAEARADQRWRRRSGTIAPGTAMRATAIRSLSEKCSPTPNISRMTPISASSPARAAIGGEARREGADHDAGQQVADQRLDAQPVGQQTEDVGQHQAGGDGGDQRCLMFRHRLSPRLRPCLSVWR